MVFARIPKIQLDGKWWKIITLHACFPMVICCSGAARLRTSCLRPRFGDGLRRGCDALEVHSDSSLSTNRSSGLIKLTNHSVELWRFKNCTSPLLPLCCSNKCLKPWSIVRRGFLRVLRRNKMTAYSIRAPKVENTVPYIKTSALCDVYPKVATKSPI